MAFFKLKKNLYFLKYFLLLHIYLKNYLKFLIFEISYFSPKTFQTFSYGSLSQIGYSCAKKKNYKFFHFLYDQKVAQTRSFK